MKKFLLAIACLCCTLFALASGTIRFKTTINKKFLPPMFPAAMAITWSNLYYQGSQCLLACNSKENFQKAIDPTQANFFAIRKEGIQGNIAKWVNGKWISTSKEYQYQLKSVLAARTKTICGYTCHAVLFSDNTGQLTSTGWVTKALPSNQGIHIVQDNTGALLGYENEKEATYATCITLDVPSNWLAIFQQVQTAVSREPARLSSPATGEVKPVRVGQPFPKFSMTDINGVVWNNKGLLHHKTLLVVWADLEAIPFPNGTQSETDFQFLQQLQSMLLKTNKSLQVIAPTFTGRGELLQKYPGSIKLSPVHVVPDAETWMSDCVQIKKYPTIVVINSSGIVVQRFEFTHGKEEYEELKKIIRAL